jgi:hypothetical protein
MRLGASAERAGPTLNPPGRAGRPCGAAASLSGPGEACCGVGRPCGAAASLSGPGEACCGVCPGPAGASLSGSEPRWTRTLGGSSAHAGQAPAGRLVLVTAGSRARRRSGATSGLTPGARSDVPAASDGTALHTAPLKCRTLPVSDPPAAGPESAPGLARRPQAGVHFQCHLDPRRAAEAEWEAARAAAASSVATSCQLGCHAA